MGLKPPVAWKDELYKNEVIKLDMQETLRKGKNENIRSDGESIQMMETQSKPVNFHFG